MKHLKFILTALALAIIGGHFSLSGQGLDIDVLTSPEVVTASTVVTADFSAVKKYIGKFDKKIMSETLNGLDIANDIHVMRNVRADRILPKFHAKPGARPLNTNITKAGQPARSFSNRIISPRHAMKIFNIIPDDYKDDFMSEQHKPGAKREPFAKFLWQKEMELLAAEINDNAYFSVDRSDAVAFAPGDTYSPGDYVIFGDDELIYECVTATTAGQSPATHDAKWSDVTISSICDGLGTILASVIANSEMPSANIVNSGTLDDENIVDYLEGLWHAIPVASRNKMKNVTFYMSYDMLPLYLTNFATKYNFHIDVNEKSGNAPLYIYGSGRKAIIKPVTWMGSSQRIIATAKDNLIYGLDSPEQTSSVSKIVETLHGYDSIARWIQCFQIRDTELLFCNENA